MSFLLALSLSACKTSSEADQVELPRIDPEVGVTEDEAPVPEASATDPSKAPTASAADASTPSKIVKLTDCSFVDPERAQDAAGKVTVKCGDKTVQATATYKGEGAYEFEVEEADLEGS
jgi:hypothetical protein